MTRFDEVVKHILTDEGGYVDHPSDPGGATNMGITRVTLARWRGVPVTDLPKSEVKNLTVEEAIKIYRKNYADKVRFDDLPAGLDYTVLDYAVNSGPDRSIRELQDQVGVAVDGVIGPNTLEAIRKIKDVKTVINRFNDDRMTFLQGLKTFPTFGKGWTRRVSGVRSLSLQMADQAVKPVKAGFSWAALIPIILTLLTAWWGSNQK